jgi:hypothetical protein
VGIAANWSRENLAWAAGLFEGEGCITRRQGVQTNLVMTMTDEDVVRRFHAIIGHGKVYGPYKTKTGVKLQWRWACTGSKHCIAVLAALWCFLGERRKARTIVAMKEMAGVRTPGANVCRRGHPFTEENTSMVMGGRACKVCRNASERRRAQERKIKNVLHKLHDAEKRNHRRAA